MRLREAGSAGEVEAVVASELALRGPGAGLDEALVSLALERLAKLEAQAARSDQRSSGGRAARNTSKRLLSRLRGAVERGARGYSAPAVASCLGSLAKLAGPRWGAAEAALAARGAACAAEMKPLAVLMATKAAVGALEHPAARPLLSALLERTATSAPAFSSQQLATALRWFASAVPEEALAQLAGPLAAAAPTLSPPDLLVVVRVCGEVCRGVCGPHAAALLAALEPAVVAAAAGLGRKGLATALAAYSQVRCPAGRGTMMGGARSLFLNIMTGI